MLRETALLWSSLNALTKRRYDLLTRVYGSIDAAAAALDEGMMRALGMREDTVAETLPRIVGFDAAVLERRLAQRGITLLTLEDDLYPAALRQLPDPPVFLYCKGDLSCLSRPLLALVGTRRMTAYGRRVTETFVPAFVRAGMVTVSGLALGIDAAVARETLDAGGRTVAVLGGGLGRIYPQENAKLGEEIVAGGGLLLSEFPLDLWPSKYTFPSRNRIVAGLSMATIVLEAPLGSGALITAELALDYNREVFAVPGQIFDPCAEGCHRLIGGGQAHLAASPTEVLQMLGVVPPDPAREQVFMPRTPEEGLVYDALSAMPQSLDELLEKSRLGAATLNAALTMMELDGAARVVEGKWIRG